MYTLTLVIGAIGSALVGFIAAVAMFLLWTVCFPAIPAMMPLIPHFDASNVDVFGWITLKATSGLRPCDRRFRAQGKTRN
jgi:hypothetical protein